MLRETLGSKGAFILENILVAYDLYLKSFHGYHSFGWQEETYTWHNIGTNITNS